MKYIIIGLFFIISTSTNAQLKYDYNWMHGYDTDLNVSGIDGFFLDFNNPLDIAQPQDLPFYIYLSNATISDNDGNLLFYTNGCDIANRDHEIMMNGDNLNPGQFHDFTCSNGYSGGNQSCLILPIPESSTQYYLFHKAAIFDPNLTIYTDKLYYTKIDISLDEGLGGIIDKNVILREDTLRAGEMTAIKHSNGEDWWLVNGSYNSDEFFTFLVTSNSIEGPFFQNIGLPDSEAGEASGQVVFSPDGTKFARYNKIDHLYLYDFDRNTGLFSNFEQIMVDDTIRSGGCAISSNSQFLYVSTGGRLFQFDLKAADIKASQVLIDEYDGWGDPFPANFYQMQLAPDCRIFMNSTNGVAVFHVINNPNEKGLDCSFQQHSFPLPSYNQISLPHFPYYRMDTDYPICDSSLVVSSTEILKSMKQEVKFYPNPTTGQLTIDFPNIIQEDILVRIFNTLGQVVQKEIVTNGIMKPNINLSSLEQGIYWVSLKGERGIFFSEKVQVIK